jgi:hypothetical protein
MTAARRPSFLHHLQDAGVGRRHPAHLIERFPDEMTIVLQNRFWDLKVKTIGFEVGLSSTRCRSI